MSDTATQSSDAPRRYLVLKGVQGWGDRLQSLLQAIGYAKRFGRTLVVDWRDRDWTHDPEEPLETWLRIFDLDYMPLREFLTLWDEELYADTVWPQAWNVGRDDHAEMRDSGYATYIYEPRYAYDANAAIESGEDVDATVLVVPGVGWRQFDAADFYRHIELCDSVRASIVATMPLKPYDVVHLRGGSKRWCGGTVPHADLDARIHDAWPTRETYFGFMEWKRDFMLRGLPEAPLYVVSDSEELAREWRERYGGTLMPTCRPALHESGIHKVPPRDLTVPKSLLTYEALRDFMLMLNARRCIGDGISLFSFMAQSLALHMDEASGWWFP